MSGITDGQRGAAAAAAIVAGSPGVGAVIMAESESSNNSAEYVQGTINGQPFRGWVGATRLQAGDKVDMIVEWQHDHYEVYAIALPEERIVSICPKCDMGHIAHMLWRIKKIFILITILMVPSIIPGLIAFSAYKSSAPTRCKLAEQIFQLLGMERVATVNLNKITKEREQ